MEPQKKTVTKSTIWTGDRVQLFEEVVERLQHTDLLFDEKLVRSTVDFLTGSSMITVNRFLYESPIQLDELERKVVTKVINFIFDITWDLETRFAMDILDLLRLQFLTYVIDDLDSRFDFLACKARITELLDEKYSTLNEENPLREDVLEGAISYLNGHYAVEVGWISASITRVKAGKHAFNRLTAQQLRDVIEMMEKYYPRAIKAERRESLYEALIFHDNFDWLSAS